MPIDNSSTKIAFQSLYFCEILFNYVYIHSVSAHLDAIKEAMASRGDQLTPREHAYIRATLAFAGGNMLGATEEIRTMLIDYPLGE